MRLKVPADFRESLPGQFVMLRIPGRDFPFLGRPLSIYSLYTTRKDTSIEILYRIAGRGTDLFSRMKNGEEVSVLGPLGHAFDVSAEVKHVMLVAGGIGVAPLSFLAEYYGRHALGNTVKMSCYLGAKSINSLVGHERMERICSEIQISTDDGSAGHHGFITDLFARDLPSVSVRDTVVYACGPHQMLKVLARILEKHPSCRCQVSIEERMACGIGTCLGCTVVTKDAGSQRKFVRACTEGPVFDIRAIDWCD
jgi:dihydroorotate dehydrogenase electron transfer subunit